MSAGREIRSLYPERPLQLKLLQPEDIEYIWNGDRLSKLVRRIDQHECDEIEVLADNLKRLSSARISHYR